VNKVKKIQIGILPHLPLKRNLSNQKINSQMKI